MTVVATNNCKNYHEDPWYISLNTLEVEECWGVGWGGGGGSILKHLLYKKNVGEH
jgi:hypothetical protein